MQVASGELAADFPQALEMTRVDMRILEVATGGRTEIAMPEPRPMPITDWAEIAPPMPQAPTIEDVDTREESDKD